MPGSVTSAVERAIAVLECFSRKEPALTITEIGQRLGLRKSTVHRLLTLLARQDMIARDVASLRYRLGPKVLYLGNVCAKQYRLRDFAMPIMRQVWEKCGETVTLTIRVGDHRMYLEQIESLQEMRVSVEIGKLLPLYCGASGKIFLAFMDGDEADQVLGRLTLAPLTPGTLTDLAQLREDLRRTRAQGYAISCGERVDGVNAVSAPLLSSQGRVTAALGISGPASRFVLERVLERAPLLVETAREVSDTFGWAMASPDASV